MVFTWPVNDRRVIIEWVILIPEKAMAPRSSTLTWKIPWMEEPGRLHSVGVAKSRTWLSDFTLTFHFSCIGEGNGNPLQCSCLENSRDGGAWWAAVSRVAQSRTQLKWQQHTPHRCWDFSHCLQDAEILTFKKKKWNTLWCWYSKTHGPINWQKQMKTEMQRKLFQGNYIRTHSIKLRKTASTEVISQLKYYRLKRQIDYFEKNKQTRPLQWMCFKTSRENGWDKIKVRTLHSLFKTEEKIHELKRDSRKSPKA